MPLSIYNQEVVVLALDEPALRDNVFCTSTTQGGEYGGAYVDETEKQLRGGVTGA